MLPRLGGIGGRRRTPVDHGLDRVSVVGVRQLWNQLGRATVQRVNAGLPIAGGTDSCLVVRLADDVDSHVAKALYVFNPSACPWRSRRLGWGLGFVSEEALEKSHVIEGYP